MLNVPKKARTTLLFLLIFLVYISSPRFLGTMDGLPTRLIPISILEEGNFDFDEFIDSSEYKNHPLYVFVEADDHYFSKYPVLSSILALPVYAIPYFAGIPFTSALVTTLAKITAALITALSAMLLFFIFRKYLSEKWSIFLVIIYAFGTSSWTISSQDLWQHGTSQLFLILVVYLLLKPKKSDLVFLLTGLAVGLAIAARYLNIIFAVIFFVYILYKYREKILSVILGASVPLTLLLIYQAYYFSYFWQTGYSCDAFNVVPCIEHWHNPFWDGFGGLLISPSRGLFVFSPFIILSIIGIWIVWKRKKEKNQEYRLLFRYLSIGVLIFTMVMSKWWAWYGGVTYGPRMLVDIVPFIMLFFIPVVLNDLFRKKAVIICFCLLIVFSIFVQFAGVIYWDSIWDNTFDSLSGDHSWLWDWNNSQLFYYLERFFQ
ncbi:hypothetical protein KKB10_04755 [Patescibacteria group bacterium]|nr:hypothetical protein [Patescibacteria group bacterium]MBU1074935.1 hypothetical protein [Patescibacteria group bacterium]MBU1951320.1 hypothetical protein [Patescibacteria group bacterium]MBU2229219.1 hypothetical protein [Patescibacteria group bacterium]